MITLDDNEFRKLPQLLSSMFGIRKKDNKLYKIFEDSHKEFVIFLNSLEPIPGILLPEDLIQDPKGYVYCYVMDFVNPSISIADYIKGANLPFDLSIANTVTSMFDTIKRAHSKFIIGDVRNENILLTDSGALFIDLENGFKLNDDSSKCCTYYKVAYKNEPLFECILVDYFKTLISSLSLYYSFNIQDNFQDNYWNINPEDILICLKEAKSPEPFIEYLDSLLTALKDPNYKIKDFKKISYGLEEPNDSVRRRLISKFHK